MLKNMKDYYSPGSNKTVPLWKNDFQEKNVKFYEKSTPSNYECEILRYNDNPYYKNQLFSKNLTK